MKIKPPTHLYSSAVSAATGTLLLTILLGSYFSYCVRRCCLLALPSSITIWPWLLLRLLDRLNREDEASSEEEATADDAME